MEDLNLVTRLNSTARETKCKEHETERKTRPEKRVNLTLEQDSGNSQ